MDLNTVTDIDRPRRREELPAWREGDALLAGGTWLFSEPQPHLRRLIDLAALDWPPLEPGAEGLRIGATCTLAQLAASEPPPAWPAAALFAPCCRALRGAHKIWNAATVGGNLCLALPAAPMAALATALDGVCVVWGAEGGERRLPALGFVTGPGRTALRPGDVLRAIDLPHEALSRRGACRQMSLTPLGRSAALLIGTVSARGFALTVTASTPRPVRLDFPAIPDAAELGAALGSTIPDGAYYDDVHGHPEWRRHMTLRLAEEIRRELADQPSGGTA